MLTTKKVATADRIVSLPVFLPKEAEVSSRSIFVQCIFPYPTPCAIGLSPRSSNLLTQPSPPLLVLSYPPPFPEDGIENTRATMGFPPPLHLKRSYLELNPQPAKHAFNLSSFQFTNREV